MTLGMTIAVDVDLLRQHRLGVLTQTEEIARLSSLDPLDVGDLLDRGVRIDEGGVAR